MEAALAGAYSGLSRSAAEHSAIAAGPIWVAKSPGTSAPGSILDMAPLLASDGCGRHAIAQTRLSIRRSSKHMLLVASRVSLNGGGDSRKAWRGIVQGGKAGLSAGDRESALVDVDRTGIINL